MLLLFYREGCFLYGTEDDRTVEPWE